MKRHDCKSKEFKDIFSQRGKRVEVSEMVKGNFYISDETRKDWSCIFEFIKKEFINEQTVVCGNLLVQTGTFWDNGDIDVVNVYEATQDQIDLLNAYKFI